MAFAWQSWSVYATHRCRQFVRQAPRCDRFAVRGWYLHIKPESDRVVAHGPQALRDAVDQVFVVATRKIRAANAACKQHITNKCTFDFGRVKHHMAGCVAWAVAHLQRVRAKRDGVAIVQPARGRESA